MAATRFAISLASGALAVVTATAQAQQPAPLPPALQQLAGLNLEGDAARLVAAAAGLQVESRDARTGSFVQLVRIVDGEPIYYTTHNTTAAATLGTVRVRNGWVPSLQGSGVQFGMWEGGWPHAQHVELSGRITFGDSGAAQRSNHATHVAGTLMASGVDAAAKGMAPLATLRAFDWNLDTTEMGNANVRISNHSYGQVSGWAYDSAAFSGGGAWVWYGPGNLPHDPEFGRYGATARDWDIVAAARPHYLIFKAAGNDRAESGAAFDEPHLHADSPGLSFRNCTHHPDGLGECISGASVAKNIMVVGAIADIPTGWVGPATQGGILTDFSSVGPADDLRIKPDIVANGEELYSSVGDGDATYASYSGTSMSSPNAAGSAALLLEYWRRLDRRTTPSDPRSATLKGLIIHTARAPSDEPSHYVGWGVMDTQAAAVALKQNFYERNGDANDETGHDVIRELLLADGGEYEAVLPRVHTGQRVRVTICWTDPAHETISGHDNLTPALVNDLDLRVIRNATGAEFKPWRLRPGGFVGYEAENNYTDDAGNVVDNVEVVEFIAPAGGDYTVRVNHKGTLALQTWDGSSQRVQPFSLIMSENHRRIIRLQANDLLAWQIAVLMSTSGEGGAILADAGTHQVGAGGITIAQPITLMASGGEATLR